MIEPLTLTYQTPLLYAVDWGNDQMVGLLLQYGADPTFAGDCKFTPLEAAKSKREKINTEGEILKDGGSRRLAQDIFIPQSIRTELSSINRIVQMLEAAIRVR